MPNITQYDAPQGIGLRPTESGIDANVQAARRIGAFASQKAEAVGKTLGLEGRMLDSSIRDAGQVAVDYEDHREISHGAAAGAQLTENLTNTWNDIAKNADPNDPSVAAKFQQEQLEPALEKFRQGFSTEKSQQWAESHVDLLRQHMFEKSSADMMTLAKKATFENAETMKNSMTNTAVSDPSSVPSLLKGLDQSLDGIVNSSPNLKGADAATIRSTLGQSMREAIVKAGAFGAIQNASNPEAAAAEWTKNYPKEINGMEAMQLAKAAKSQNKINNAYDKAAQLQQKQELVADFHEKYSKLTASTVQADGTLRAGPDYFKQMAKLANHPGIGYAPEGALKAGIAFGQEINANPRNDVTDPHTDEDFGRRVVLPPTDPDALSEVDIIKAKTQGLLSDRSFQFYQSARTRMAQDPSRALTEKLFEQRMADFKPAIVKAGPFDAGDPMEVQKYGQFRIAARELTEEAYKRGGNEEVRKLMKPGGELDQIIPKFVASKAQAQKELNDYNMGKKRGTVVPPIDWRSAVTNPSFNGRFPPQANPGETPASFLDRVKKLF